MTKLSSISRSVAGLAVVDLGYGMASAIVAKLLADLGARVRRFEPESGDPFYSIYAAYPVWHRRATTQRVPALDSAAVATALAECDICLTGGEDFPGYRWRINAASIADTYRGTIILEVGGHPNGDDRPATELLAQARSGLCFEQYTDRPVQLAFSPASYCAALHGLTGVFAALCSRTLRGKGQLVRTSLYEGALTLGTQFWMHATNPVRGFNVGVPKNPRQLIFRCRDDRYVHVVLGSFGSKGSLYRILGINDPDVKPEDSGVPTGQGDPANFFGNVDLLARHAAPFDSHELLEQLLAARVPAHFVAAPGECWDYPQVGILGSVERDAGGIRHIGLPLRGQLGEVSNDKLTFGDNPARPLEGLRVLDYGIFVAGPYAGVALADLGADVIKIETPQGDPNRNIARSYAAVNRGKRAITVDLKSPEGQQISQRLIASAQVVLNNFRPGVSQRLGLDPVSLHATDPDKIVLETTGFGRSGPEAERPGFDMIIQAYCGHEVRAGGIGDTPVWDRTAMIDYVCGLMDQVLIVLAAWRRLEGHGGADLDSCLVDAGLLLMAELIQRADGTFDGAPSLQAGGNGFHPAEALYPCRDGCWIALGARGEEMAAALAAVLGLSLPARREWGPCESVAIRTALLQYSVDAALALLRGAGVWAEACAANGQVEGFEVTRSHPVFGEISQLGALFSIDGARPASHLGVPVAGQHTAEILSELGYPKNQITDYFVRGIVA